MFSFYNKNIQGLIAYENGKGSDVFVAEKQQIVQASGAQFNKINFPYRFSVGFTFKAGIYNKKKLNKENQQFSFLFRFKKKEMKMSCCQIVQKRILCHLDQI